SRQRGFSATCRRVIARTSPRRRPCRRRRTGCRCCPSTGAAAAARATDTPGERMIKSISLLTRKAWMTHDQFVRHWVEVHAPLALVPGLRRYVQSHIVDERTRPDVATTEVDATRR